MADRYDIFVSGFEDLDRAVEALSESFGVEVEAAARIVMSVPRVVKHDVPLDVAERYFNALHAAGGKVELRKLGSKPPPPRGPGAPASIPPPKAAPSSIPPPRVTPSSGAPVVVPSGALPSWFAQANQRYAPSSRPPPKKEKGPFVPALARAYLYPFQKTAPPIFIGLALVAQLLGYVPFVGGVLQSGVLLVYFFSVIRSSANGHDDLPMGGDFTDFFSDFVAPIIRYLLAVIVSMAPAVAVGLLGDATKAYYLPALIGTAALGLLYLPAGIMLAAHGEGCIGGLNVIAGVRMIFRVPGAYLLTTIAFAINAGLDFVLLYFLGMALQEAVAIPFLPGFIALLIGLYPSTVSARMLGLFLHHHEEELGFS